MCVLLRRSLCGAGSSCHDIDHARREIRQSCQSWLPDAMQEDMPTCAVQLLRRVVATNMLLVLRVRCLSGVQGERC